METIGGLNTICAGLAWSFGTEGGGAMGIFGVAGGVNAGLDTVVDTLDAACVSVSR